MRAAFWIAGAAAILLAAAATADAGPCDATCTVNKSTGDVTYPCDYTCPGGICYTVSLPDVCPYTCHNSGGVSNGYPCETQPDCDDQGAYQSCGPGGEGVITVCGTSGHDEIRLSGNNLAVCGNEGDDDIISYTAGPVFANGNDGNDYIPGTGGNDRIMGGAGSDHLGGGTGDDVIFGLGSTSFGADGDNVIDGNDGADTLWGAAGHDVIDGSDGNDTIVGQGGRDELNGGPGNDFILTSYGVTPANSILGTLLCGNGGDDTLVGDGPGHQCMDGGDGQAVVGAEKDCTYANVPDDGDDHDAGTARNCLAAVKTSTNGTLLADQAACGCD